MRDQTYEVRVRGPVTRDVLDELGATSLAEEPAHTVILTEPMDQAALQGMLEHIRSLGLELLELRTSVDAEVQSEEPPR
ncbi:MAG: hypothetical protein ACJ74U_02555 [Jatrophihabitantaceae bacterium]